MPLIRRVAMHTTKGSRAGKCGRHAGRWWLNWNASEDLRSFIERNATRAEHDLACGLASIWWAEELTDADYGVTLIDGMYTGEGHSWLEVDGVLFDPTAAQFDDFPEMDESAYVEHIREDRRHKWY